MTTENSGVIKNKAEIILSAAGRVLDRCGYAGATIVRVAEEAGVSRGLLHYYFKNKEEMLAKVLRANMAPSIILVRTLFEESKSSDALSKRITDALRSLAASNPDYFALFFEGIVAARHSDAIREEIGLLYRRFRDMVREELVRWYERHSLTPSLHADGLAALITGILDGMGLQIMTITELIDDNTVWETVNNALVLLLEGNDSSKRGGLINE